MEYLWDIYGISVGHLWDILTAATNPKAAWGEANIDQLSIEEVFATFPDAHWGNPRHFIFGNRGLSEWIFTGTRRDGTKIEVTGCDIFTFKDGKISIKNSFRKNRIPNK